MKTKSVVLNHYHFVKEGIYSSNGNILFVVTAQGITQWDVRTGTLINTATFMPYDISSIAFSPDKQLCAIGVYGGQQIKLLKTSNNKCIKNLKDYTKPLFAMTPYITFSPDGMLAGADANYLKLWNIYTGYIIRKILLTLDRDPNPAVVFYNNEIFANAVGSNIKLWNKNTEKVIKTLKVEKSLRKDEQYSSEIEELRREIKQFSPDGKLLVSSKGNKIELWNVDTGNAKVLNGNDDCTTRSFHTALSPNGKYLASIPKFLERINFWDTNTGDLIQTIDVHSDQQIEFITFSPNGILAVGYGNTVEFWHKNGEKWEKVTDLLQLKALPELAGGQVLINEQNAVEYVSILEEPTNLQILGAIPDNS